MASVMLETYKLALRPQSSVFRSSLFLQNSRRRCPEIYLLCFQAEGGKKAEAVATVVAAVDLARVRLPVHEEGGLADEEEELEIRQQGRKVTAAEQVVETTMLPAEPAAAVTSERHGVQVSQVG